jgi:fatty-acid desaturase
MNWTTALEKPHVYLEYANLTWSGTYRNIINGWFARHLQPTVVFIAICQGLIALSMLLNGWIFKTGAIGAIFFLLAIIPFGIGSGFPTTLIMAIAMLIIVRKHADQLIWVPNKKQLLV